MKSDGNDVVIIYNGELYNTIEIRKELMADGFIFHGHSDTEVVLNLYFKYGSSLLSKMNGIFAFAIWDKRSKELFLARDNFGVKPLYYVSNNGNFIFSSEIKAILTDKSISRSINPQTVVNNLVYLWSPGENTMFESINKLEPGFAMIVIDGKVTKKWEYYDIPFSSNPQNISVSEAIDQTRHYLSKAVKRQLISDVPIGAFLSGGLDSSSIVAFAKHNLRDQNFQTFSVDYNNMAATSEGVVDDLPFARQVSKYLNVNLNIVSIESSILNDLEKMIYYMDEPQADLAPLNVLLISKLAKEKGIKVLLSGVGGDDIFTGYRRHFALMQERYWSWLPQSMRSLLSFSAGNLPAQNHMLRRISKAFRYVKYNDDKRLSSYFYWLSPELVHDVLAPNINDKTKHYDPATPMINTLRRLPKDVDPLNKLLYLETKHFLPDHNLNYTDKMGMAEGVEIRVPFLDVDLVSFAASLPVSYKQHGKTSKWVLKKAMEGMLPNSVIYRRKSGFPSLMRYWLSHDLKAVVDDTLSDDSIKRRGYFNVSGVRKLRKLDASGRIDAAYPIYSMVCMELWSRIFVDQTVPDYKY